MVWYVGHSFLSNGLYVALIFPRDVYVIDYILIKIKTKNAKLNKVEANFGEILPGEIL